MTPQPTRNGESSRVKNGVVAPTPLGRNNRTVISSPVRLPGYKSAIALRSEGTTCVGSLTSIFFAISRNIYISLALLVLYGATDSVSVIIRSTVIQLLTPNEMRGRVGAVNSMFIITSNEIGAFESGLAAKLFGLVPSVLIGGVMTLLTVGIVAAAAPKLRKLRGEDIAG